MSNPGRQSLLIPSTQRASVLETAEDSSSSPLSITESRQGCQSGLVYTFQSLIILIINYLLTDNPSCSESYLSPPVTLHLL